MITRRVLIAGVGALLASPAIVRASSLMPIKPWVWVPPRSAWVEAPYLDGPYGNIPVRFAAIAPSETVIFVGASEPVSVGDVVIIENGLARPAGPFDAMSVADIVNRTLGVAQASSASTPWPTPQEPMPLWPLPAGTVVRY